MFTFKISVDGNWVEIPEQIFYDSLYRHANKLTPLISRMLKDEVITFGGTRYRIDAVKRNA